MRHAVSDQPKTAGAMFAVTPVDELEDGHVRLFEVDGRKVILVRIADDVHALQGVCTHAKSILGPARLTEECLIECPMHGALFSPVDGSVHKAPALVGLQTYRTRITDGVVHVELPERVAATEPPAARPERWW